MSYACALLARSTRTSVLEVTTTEVGLVLEVNQSINQSKHLFKHDKIYSIADVVVNCKINSYKSDIS